MTVPAASSPLRGLVRMIWASPPDTAPARREMVLPTGDIHLVLRLGDAPLTLFDAPSAPAGRTVSTSVIGGARSTAYCRAVAPGSPAVGVLMAPGACRALTGVPAGLLEGRHVALEDVWSPALVAEMRERLAAVETGARPALLRALLTARLDADSVVDARLMAGMRALVRQSRIDEAAAAVGLSRRHFSRQFAEAVGLSPRDWLRTRRFDRLLRRLHGGRAPLAVLAAEAGYADQAHMSREFLRMAGMTPAQFRRRAPAAARHVPLDPDDVPKLQDR